MKILHIVAGLSGGGIGSLLYNYYINMDRNVYHFDFAVNSDGKGFIESRFKELGCEIFITTPLHDDFLKCIKQFKNIIKNGNYDVVHCHTGYRGIFPLYYAWKYNVKTRIIHIHGAYEIENLRQRMIRGILSPVSKFIATDWLACGNTAAQWFYGKRALFSGKVKIMKNAIDIRKYQFLEMVRKEVRDEFGLFDDFAIVSVGRLSLPKNHEFMIKVFEEVADKIINSKLILIGDGELDNKIRKIAFKSKCRDRIQFWGIRTDIHRLLNGMDLFLLTSTSEGVPVALLEAQANGLHIVSSDSVTKEIQVSDLITYVGLTEPLSNWGEIIKELHYKIINLGNRKDVNKKLSESGYEIKKEAQWLSKFYIEKVHS